MGIKWRGPGSNPTTARESNGSGPSTGREVAHGKARPAANIDLGNVSAMGPGESAVDFVRTARSRMGMLARFGFDRQTQKSLQQAASDIAVNYLNAQREVMIDKIVSSVQLSKRKTLEDFLRIAVEQDKNLLVLTNTAQAEMFNLVQEEVMAVLEDKKHKVDAAGERLNAGRLLKDDYDALIDIYTQTAAKLIEDKFDRMDKISESYIDSFERALKKYKETAAAAQSRMGEAD